ncbi:hypothetical protein F4809DRAFT_458602 [Biscogniauxia mediterranea]|nr:hypothetical protein F4809DRAFT_458602 [Biscogniauxia mediterranea]
MQLERLLIFLSALAVTSASPLGRRSCSIGNGTTTTQPGVPAPSTSTTASASVTYTLPSAGGPTPLTSPGNATLKHIAVGHGIQNYTCTAAGATASSIGALAVLWEITGLYPGSGAGAMSSADWVAFPPKVLRTTALPLNPAASTSVADAADASAPFPAPAELAVDGLAAPLAFLGHHYFDEQNAPTFDLPPSSELFKGKKDQGVAAPADADPGLDDTGAVDWLRLSDKGGSQGVSLVYRVLTAGGSPSACTQAGQAESIPYTAMYWFY